MPGVLSSLAYFNKACLAAWPLNVLLCGFSVCSLTSVTTAISGLLCLIYVKCCKPACSHILRDFPLPQAVGYLGQEEHLA